MITFIGYVFIFWIGFLLGFLVKGLLTRRFTEYGGTIIVDTDELMHKKLYSLVLDDYPEKLEFKKEIVFRVDHNDTSSDRESNIPYNELE